MKNLAQLIKDLNENEELRTKFESAVAAYKGEETNPEAVRIAIAKDFGYEPDENEAAKIQAAGEELNLEDLDNVAGGIMVKYQRCTWLFKKGREKKADAEASIGSDQTTPLVEVLSPSKINPLPTEFRQKD